MATNEDFAVFQSKQEFNMNMIYIFKARTAKRLLSIALIFALLLMPMSVAWGRGGGGAAAPITTPPLNQITNPVLGTTGGTVPAPAAVPPQLVPYIKDMNAAIQLGKALFWDMQAGSDGKVACATCHFHAGADSRLNSTLHPDGTNFGVNGSGVSMSSSYTLAPADFPFFQVAPVDGPLGITPPATAPVGTVTRNIGNVVVGSQGVSSTIFTGLSGTALDNGTPVSDPIFGSLRRVTGRNAPSIINAVFNFANFWDGRANNIFNGVNPFGPLDQSASIWSNSTGSLVQQQIAIPNASLASQAVGPPLNPVEMSFAGRTFPELGRKMLNNAMIPLGQQHVDPADSVLKTLINGGGKPGLNTNYKTMIQAAFVDILWNNNAQTVPLPATVNGVATTLPFSQIEANFSLFWGLSIMLYEATLVSDRSPFDRFLLGNQNVVSLNAQKGFNTFGSKCATCHSGSEFTSAVVGSDIPGCIAPACNFVSFGTNTDHGLILDNQTNMTTILQVTDVISDSGFFNIGVRRTSEDLGRAGNAPFVDTNIIFNQVFPLSQIFPASKLFPLSFSRLARLQDNGPFPFLFETPFLLPGTSFNTPDAVDGSFKVAGLRNVELTAPYFHNGSVFTLDQVVQFYVRGGNFPFNLPDPPGGNIEQAITVQPLGKLRGNPAGQNEMVEFLMSLTDDRVRNEQTPFDHPELFIPDGTGPDVQLLATGGGPVSAPVTTFTMNPVTTPTIATFQTITGTVDSTATVSVTVNGLVSAATVTLTNWNFLILSMPVGTNTIITQATSSTDIATAPTTTTIVVLPVATLAGTPQNVTKETGLTLTVGGFGVAKYDYKLDNGAFNIDIPVATNLIVSNLADGTHTLTVLGKDVSGVFQQPLADATILSWLVKSTPPVLTINPVTSTVRGSLTISGTVDLGIIPEVLVNKTATIGQVSIIGGSGISTWSCTISGLKNGAATITALATDIAFNQTQKTTGINVILPDGAFKGNGVTDVTDAVKALRFAVKLATPSADDLLRGDVAPLGTPDGVIDENDALLILKKAVGLVNF
jgi:cytochrome c peroxidase